MHISPILCELHIYTLQLWIVLNRKLRAAPTPASSWPFITLEMAYFTIIFF